MAQTKTKYEKIMICDSCKAENYVYTFSDGMTSDEVYTCHKCGQDFNDDEVTKKLIKILRSDEDG